MSLEVIKMMTYDEIYEDKEKDEQLKCMNCGTTEDVKEREAPSGSFLPRCPSCLTKRWNQFYNSDSEQMGVGYEGSEEDLWG